jgi:hypothetical protein
VRQSHDVLKLQSTSKKRLNLSGVALTDFIQGADEAQDPSELMGETGQKISDGTDHFQCDCDPHLIVKICMAHCDSEMRPIAEEVDQKFIPASNRSITTLQSSYNDPPNQLWNEEKPEQSS